MEPKNSDPAAVYFIKCLIKRYIDDDVGSFASEASYCFILGLIPFMIFLVNCILFFAAPQLDTILDLLQYLPAQFAASMEENIARIIAGRSTIWLFAGLGGAVWTASQGTAVLVRGMDKIFFQDRNIQSWFKVSLKACFFTVFLVFAMILSLTLIVFANAVVFLVQDYIMELPPVFWQVWRPSRYAIPFVVMSLSLSAFYRYAPNRYITKWTRIISGGGGPPFPNCRVRLLYPPYIGYGRHLRFPHRPDLPLSLDPSGSPDYSCRRCGDHGMGRYASPAPVRIFPVAGRKNYRHPK